MDAYRTFMAATQTANTINSRRAAVAAQATLDHLRDEAERTRYYDECRQRVFELAKLAQSARECFPAHPAGALYLALRGQAALATVTERDLPSIQDKAARHEVERTLTEVTAGAEAALPADAAQDVTRLTYLDLVLGDISRLAAWRDIEKLAAPFGHSFDIASANAGRVVVGSVVLAFVGCWFSVWLVGKVPYVGNNVLALVVLVGWAYFLFRMLAGKASAAKRVAAAKQIAGAAGDTFDGTMDDAYVRARVKDLRESLLHSHVPADVVNSPDVRSAAEPLFAERTTLFAKYLESDGIARRAIGAV